MPLYLIERQFAEQLELSADGLKALDEVNTEAGVEWLYSFLSADKRKTYCLYQAPDPDSLLRAAAKAGIPADKIVEVSQLDPRTAVPSG